MVSSTRLQSAARVWEAFKTRNSVQALKLFTQRYAGTAKGAAGWIG
jgi:hypothetical protein